MLFSKATIHLLSFIHFIFRVARLLVTILKESFLRLMLNVKVDGWPERGWTSVIAEAAQSVFMPSYQTPSIKDTEREQRGRA